MANKTSTQNPAVVKAQEISNKAANKLRPAVTWLARGLAKIAFVILALDRVQIWLNGRVFDPTLALAGAAALTAGLLYIAVKK